MLHCELPSIKFHEEHSPAAVSQLLTLLGVRRKQEGKVRQYGSVGTVQIEKKARKISVGLFAGNLYAFGYMCFSTILLRL